MKRMYERRFLLFMPEYVAGGAETQFRYLIDYAEENKWNLDVIIEHRTKKKIEILPKSVREMKNVRVYELDWRKADYMKMRYDVMVHILRKTPHIQYSTCLIYYPSDLALAPLLRSMGIHVIYSERTAGSAISQNRLFQKYLSGQAGDLAVCRLPSTSPANAAWSLEQLVEAWEVIKERLE